ncbi:hypothetical protein [Streptomyces flavidovirens]|uniref:hypothetical protein n=1 Tax=Streptomyces flavidovirens TaxID=67298 RepID=UPI003F55004A
MPADTSDRSPWLDTGPAVRATERRHALCCLGHILEDHIQLFAQARFPLDDACIAAPTFDTSAGEGRPTAPGRPADVPTAFVAAARCSWVTGRPSTANMRAADGRRVVHLHYAEAARKVARDYFSPLARGTDAARGRLTLPTS